MINKYRIMTNRILSYLVDIENKKRERLASLKKFDGLLLKEKKRSSGKTYYSSYKAGSKGKNAEGKVRYRYIGDNTSETVLRIKEVHHLKKSLALLGKDIQLLKYVLNTLENIDAGHVNEVLPAVYRTNNFRQEISPDRVAAEWKRSREAYKATLPVYYPEELKVPTLDGSMVRSKSEALIYNFLLNLGITFVYELPIKTSDRMFYPDFSILSEIDYTSVYRIEHQGMMEDDFYSERFNDKVRDYIRAGYTPGLNIFFTFDSNNGSLDFEPFLDIIHLKIRPPSNEGTAA